MVRIPQQPEVFRSEIEPNLKAGKPLSFEQHSIEKIGREIRKLSGLEK